MKKKDITVTIARHLDEKLGKPNQVIRIGGAGVVSYAPRTGATKYYRVGDRLSDEEVDVLAEEYINLVVVLKNH